MRRALEIVARPFEQPDQPLRPGDVMLRATPGTGDIGHVMVLVSGDLRTASALAADGITEPAPTRGFVAANTRQVPMDIGLSGGERFSLGSGWAVDLLLGKE